MKCYKIEISKRAGKALRKLDRQQQVLLLKWIKNHLLDCADPRLYGKPMTGSEKGYWRYRVGVYRIIAEIEDDVLKISILRIGHRREIYQ